MLNHGINRASTSPASVTDGFIFRYVFPDGELEGPGHIISECDAVSRSGTREPEGAPRDDAAAWCANLTAHWDEAVPSR